MTTNLEQKLRDPVFLSLVSQLRKRRQAANEMHTKVKPIVQAVFNRYSFFNDVENGTRKLTDPDQLHLSEDEEQVHTFYQEIDDAFRAHGLLTDEDPFGTWSDLKEDHKCTEIEWAILKHTPEFDTWQMDVRERYFDLLLKLDDLLEG